MYFFCRFIAYIILLAINLVISDYIHLLFFSRKVHLYKYAWLIFLYVVSYVYNDLTNKRMLLVSELYLTLKANILTLIVTFIFLFLFKISAEYSRFIILSFFVLNILLPIPMFALKKLCFFTLKEKAFVVYDESGLNNLDKWKKSVDSLGIQIVGSIKMNDKSLRLIIKDIDRFIKEDCSISIISIGNASFRKSAYLIDYIHRNISSVILLPRTPPLPLFSVKVMNNVSYGGIGLIVTNNLLNALNRSIKGAVDFIASLMIFVILLPVMVLVYVTILVIDKHNPIFVQERVGYKGNIFRIYKFRTMVDNPDEVLEKYLSKNEEARLEFKKFRKLKKDPRITKVGKILRKFSIDELPQIVNVIKGDMSLVGPRPYLPEEVKNMGKHFEYYKMVKPGMTGLWQVSGRNELKFSERVKLDTWYVKNWTLELDFIILLKTFYVVLSGKGSY